MKNITKKLLSISLVAATTLSLTACSQEVAESAFDDPLPWHATTMSYEKLEYGVAVYNTQNGDSSADRIKIADGKLEFILDESLPYNGEYGYTTLTLDFTVKYDNTEHAGVDAGLTDNIRSRVVFEPNSLSANYMEKTVTLADRKDKTNLSYQIKADYFGTHSATISYFKQTDAPESTLDLPGNACHDNEMMFYMARAQQISGSSSTNFKMVNLFDSFNNQSLTEYRMVVTGSSEQKIDIGSWVKDYGIAAVGDGDDSIYPVNCYTTSIAISDEKHGPSYSVLYSKDDFTSGDIAHKKLPVQIDYSTYDGAKPYRRTSYTLTACSFTK